MKNIFLLFLTICLLGFSQGIVAKGYKPQIIGKDTSECLKTFPKKFKTETKQFLINNYFGYIFKSDSFSLTQFFTPDSQIICQKAFIGDRLISAIAFSRNNKLISDFYLKCGTGKIRDYNWIFQMDQWQGIIPEISLGITDLYYVNGKVETKVDFAMYGKDTISLQRFKNGKLNGWSAYYYLGKRSYNRLYENGMETKLEFVGKGKCKQEDLVFDSLTNCYKLNGEICNGKISIFTLSGFFNGMLDREVFFTNGKVDSVIVCHSSQWALIFKVVVDYHSKTWIVYQYYPDGHLNWINKFIFDTIPDEKDKILEFPSKGAVKSDGISTTYYENGTIQNIATFKNGIKDGKWIFYDESGKIAREMFYKNDVIVTGN